MDTNSFLTKYYSEYSDEYKTRVINWLSWVEESLSSPISKEGLQAQDKPFFCRLFLKDDTPVARTKYFMIKAWLKSLLDYYELSSDCIPTRDEVLSALENKNYFKCLADVLAYIDYAGQLRMQDYKPSSLLNLKAICILGWYGFSLEDMVAALISDLEEHEGCYYIRLKSSLIQLNHDEYQLLKFFAMTDIVQSYPGGRITYYKEGSTLFRPVLKSSTGDTSSIDSLKSIIKKFNNNNPNNINISIISLRKNRVFTQIYSDKSDLSLLEKIEKYYTSDKTMIGSFKKEYLMWLKTI